MSELITLRAEDGHSFSAWSSAPLHECRGGVIVLHAVFGLTSHIGEVCDKWAAAGFKAIAPALFDRLGENVIHPYGRTGAEAGSGSYGRLTHEQILTDVRACQQALASFGPVAISGFCTGASWAWTAAANLQFSAQVAFYGSHIHERLGEQPLCPTQLHFGLLDHVVSRSEQERIAAAHPALEMHIYEGAGHAFMNPEQEFFDANSAALAWRNALAFVETSFGLPGVHLTHFRRLET